MITVPLQPYYIKLREYHDRHILKKSEEQIIRLRISSASRNYGDSKKFEDWLFSEGVIITRKNKKMYLSFISEEQATMFLLKWGTK